MTDDDDLPHTMIEYPDLEPYRIGVVHRYGMPGIVCYDLEGVLSSYQKDGMTYEEALEYFEFNVIGAWFGESTPCFLDRFDPP
jgi:hypothetical protein